MAGLKGTPLKGMKSKGAQKALKIATVILEGLSGKGKKGKKLGGIQSIAQAGVDLVKKNRAGREKRLAALKSNAISFRARADANRKGKARQGFAP